MNSLNLASGLLAGGLALTLLPASFGGRRRLLARFGKHLRVRFETDRRGRLAQGPEVERAVLSLLARPRRATGIQLASLATATVLLMVGPHLSTSAATSISVAALCMAAVVLPILVLHPFLQAFVDQSSESGRDSTVEDYLSPVARVVGWLTAVGMLAIPVAAVVAARSGAFDGSKLWWEGLVGLPASVVVGVVVVEVSGRRVTDRAGQIGMLHLWDALRSQAARTVLSTSLVLAGLAWTTLANGLHGVALTAAPAPAWAREAWQVSQVLSVLQFVGVLVVLASPWRFRRRLWPSHDLREPIAF